MIMNNDLLINKEIIVKKSYCIFRRVFPLFRSTPIQMLIGD